MSDQVLHPVTFIGAGPGDPDLITVAGMKALKEADLIVYAGSLVSREMLSWAPGKCELVDSARLELEETVTCMAEGHRAGSKVVRLHSGDPSLYGAIHEQIRALDELGVAWRVIPGVTAAFAAAASLGIEFTLPEISQSLIVSRVAGRTPVPPAEDLRLMAEHRTSLVVYLSSGLAPKVSAALKDVYGPQAPVAVVYRVSWPDEQVLWTTLSSLAADMEAAGIERQALIMVGPGVEAVAPGQGGGRTRSKLYDPAFSHGFRQGRDK